MYEVLFALVGAATGLVLGGVELAGVCLFLGSLFGMLVGLLQR